ncbi:hypothetical protein, partial [Muricoccus nepalensis]|uniref:hypothetical protein n=1 Tax=Muricoccus nepalensis TaxID=1854500 RepID=UPI0019D51FD7
MADPTICASKSTKSILRIIKVAVLALGLSLPSAVRSAHAAPTLDQVNAVPPSSASLYVGEDPSWRMVYYPVQTLTVGTAGLLTSVELDVQRLSGMGTLTVSLFPVVQEYNPPVFGSLLAAIVVAGEAVSTSMS